MAAPRSDTYVTAVGRATNSGENSFCDQIATAETKAFACRGPVPANRLTHFQNSYGILQNRYGELNE
jgi:hypothetical protein